MRKVTNKVISFPNLYIKITKQLYFPKDKEELSIALFGSGSIYELSLKLNRSAEMSNFPVMW